MCGFKAFTWYKGKKIHIEDLWTLDDCGFRKGQLHSTLKHPRLPGRVVVVQRVV